MQKNLFHQIPTKQDAESYKLRCIGQYTETLSNVNTKRAQYITLSNLSYLLGFVAILWHGYSFFPDVSDILCCETAVALMGVFFYCVSSD